MNPLTFSAVLLLATGALAQYRPFYAGSGVNYPRPFKGESEDGLGNRFGGDTTELTSRVNEFGYDKKLVEQVAKLPDSQKPFWYINQEQIRKQIGLNPSSASQVNQPNQPVRLVSGIPIIQRNQNQIQPVSVQLVQPALDESVV